MNGSPPRPPLHKLAVELAVMLGITLVLALIGPFGTWESSLGNRLIAWAIFTFGGYACFRPVIAAGTAFAAQSPLPRWAAIVAACALAALPTTLIVAATFAGGNWAALRAGDLAGLYLQVLVIGGAVTAIQLLVRREPAALPPAVSAAAEPAPPPIAEPTPRTNTLLDQLPPHLGREILCVENEDHYIRVHTTAGNALILMRLRDAIAQLADIDGEQVHRSWWVARAAVANVIRTERRIELRLTDGRDVPVSRTGAALLRERGWL